MNHLILYILVHKNSISSHLHVGIWKRIYNIKFHVIKMIMFQVHNPEKGIKKF